MANTAVDLSARAGALGDASTVSVDITAAVDFASAIERFVVLASGRGLFLSGKDHALLERWHARGLRFEDACRGLAAGFARYREEHGVKARWPRSLKYFEAAIMASVTRSHELGPEVHRAPAPVVTEPIAAVSLREELLWIGAEESDPRRRAAWQLAVSHDAATDPTIDRDTALDTLDAVLAEAFVARLEPAELDALNVAVDQRLRPERASLSPRALVARRSVIVRQELERRHGLLVLGNSTLGATAGG
jgi:hypothetical protein